MTENHTAIIHLWDVFLVPVQANMADEDAERLTTRVLQEVSQAGPRGVIIDVSSVQAVDSHLCSMLSNMAAAVRLLGSGATICGLSAEVALTLETMGVSLGKMTTMRSLEEALLSFDIAPRSRPDDSPIL